MFKIFAKIVKNILGICLLESVAYDSQIKENSELTPNIILLVGLECFSWKLMVVVMATMQAASTTSTSSTSRIHSDEKHQTLA